MSLYDVSSLSNIPSLSTAILNAVMCLSNFSGVCKNMKDKNSYCLVKGYFRLVCLFITRDLTEARDWSI